MLNSNMKQSVVIITTLTIASFTSITYFKTLWCISESPPMDLLHLSPLMILINLLMFLKMASLSLLMISKHSTSNLSLINLISLWIISFISHTKEMDINQELMLSVLMFLKLKLGLIVNSMEVKYMLVLS